MVSQTAKEDIEQLITDGLMPSVNDIIRLNALGLKLEKSPTSSDELFYMPRIAYLGDIILRQPTLGHEIWFDEVARIVDMTDAMTNLAVTAYACSVFDSDDLPKPDSKFNVVKELAKFKRMVRKFTISQIITATRYVCDGNDAELYEYPVMRDIDKQSMPKEDVSIPIGILLDGIAVGLKMTINDAKKMTSSKYKMMVRNYLRTNGMIDSKAEKENATGEYFATLEAIRKRLEDASKKNEGMTNGCK